MHGAAYLVGAWHTEMPQRPPGHLVPGPLREHGGEQGVHVARIHGLRVLLDAILVSEDKCLPKLRIAIPKLIRDLPARLW